MNNILKILKTIADLILIIMILLGLYFLGEFIATNFQLPTTN